MMNGSRKLGQDLTIITLTAMAPKVMYQFDMCHRRPLGRNHVTLGGDIRGRWDADNSCNC